MKTLFIALLLGLMGCNCYAQNTEIQIGRHGSCNSGRGICGIQSKTNTKTNNAFFLKDSRGNLVLRLYKKKLSKAQVDMIFGKNISSESTLEFLQIDQGFELDSNTKNLLYQSTGIRLNSIDAKSFEAVINQQNIDIIILKSQS